MRIFLIILGVVMLLAGALWTLQGLDLLGQTGGMNGQTMWAIIGPIVAVVGLLLLVTGVRRRKIVA